MVRDHPLVLLGRENRYLSLFVLLQFRLNSTLPRPKKSMILTKSALKTYLGRSGIKRSRFWQSLSLQINQDDHDFMIFAAIIIKNVNVFVMFCHSCIFFTFFMIFAAIIVKNVNVFVIFCNFLSCFVFFHNFSWFSLQSWSKSVHTITDDSQNKSIEIDSSLTWGCDKGVDVKIPTFFEQWSQSFFSGRSLAK